LGICLEWTDRSIGDDGGNRVDMRLNGFHCRFCRTYWKGCLHVNRNVFHERRNSDLHFSHLNLLRAGIDTGIPRSSSCPDQTDSDVVASTTATNGEIRANLGDSTTGSGIDRSVPFWGIDGFLSRPLNPDADGAAQYLFYCDGNQRYAIGSRDRRFFTGLETIDVGDRMIYAPSGIRIRLDDSEEAIEHRIPGGTTQYLAVDSFFVALNAGTRIELDNSTCDVTKLGTAENVALYAPIQPLLQEIVDSLQLLIAGDPMALPTPVPGLGTVIAALPGGALLSAALVTQLGLVQAAAASALSSSIASSSVLRASPT
jgi:hypothetical protein